MSKYHSYSALAGAFLLPMGFVSQNISAEEKTTSSSNLQQLEQRIQSLEAQIKQNRNPSTNTSNNFNPAISLILTGAYNSFDNNPDNYKLPGYMLGSEAGLGEEGFSLNHTELVMSANIDEHFFGKMTLALAEHNGSTEVELEEAYIQTLGLGHGLTVKAGRFFSALGYLNEQHPHAWDFNDAPLIYRGLFGDQLLDDGLSVNYIAATDVYLQLGAEALSGAKYPAAGSHSNIGAWTVFANLGDDIDHEQSWQLGLSHWQADSISGRTSSSHSHSGSSTAETPSFSGSSKITAIDLVYKWAPNGNPKQRHLKLQFEYFHRTEDGTITMLNSGPPVESSTYDGTQKGWYAQAVYQFMPKWQMGLRYDQLESDNSGADTDVLSEANLTADGHEPKRYSAMLAWNPSEYSRIRLQYNHDKSYNQSDDQYLLQYTVSLGSHGAHQY